MKSTTKKNTVLGISSKWISILSMIILFFTLQSSGCRKDTTETNNNPIIGTPGPAGGIVFYDKGYYSEGWRYMEVSPIELTSDSGVFWGCNSTTSASVLGMGYGKPNTQIIVDYQTPLNTTTGCDDATLPTAAKLAQNFVFNGYSDWFLPSRDELFWVMKNIASKGIGGFYQNQNYWTSTEHLSSDAYYESPQNYEFYDYNSKTNRFRVRAIRAY